MQTTNIRQERGQIIAQVRRAIKRINKVTYRVKSQTTGKFYHIKATNIGWKCDCPDPYAWIEEGRYLSVPDTKYIIIISGHMKVLTM